MASGVELATAYVSLTVEASKIAPETAKQFGAVERQADKSGKSAGKNLGAGVTSGAKSAVKGVVGMFAGIAAGIGIKNFLGDAIGEARESQKVGALTASVIKATGGAAKVTADHIGTLSTRLSNQAGIDDEVIQSGANMLLTFKNIRNEVGKGNDIFDQSTSVLTDMAAAMGTEPKQAAIQLGKALNDPIKGVAALGRVGVQFTKSQKDQIKTLVESGKTMDAQKIILKELNSEFGGAAAAQATAGDKAKVAMGNLKETIGTALLPVIDKMANFFTNKVAPAVTGFFDDLEHGTGVAGKIKDVIGKITSAVSDFWAGLTLKDPKSIGAPLEGFVAVGQKVRDKIKTIVAAAKDLWNTWGPLVKEFAAKAIEAAPGIFDKIQSAIGKVVDVVKSVTGFLSDHKTTVQAVTVAVLAGVTAYKAIKLALGLWTVATKAYAVAQGLMNAVMAANPISLVIIAIAALAAGLVYAYKHSETFRDIVDGAFHAVAAAGKWMWDSVLKPTFRFVVAGFLGLVGGIINGAADAFGWVPGLGPKLKSAAAKFNTFKDEVNYSLSQIHDKVVNVDTYYKEHGIRPTTKGAVRLTEIHDRFASGTNFAPGGPALVGEQGPEIVNLPRGSQVIPAGPTAAMLGGGGIDYLRLARTLRAELQGVTIQSTVTAGQFRTAMGAVR